MTPIIEIRGRPNASAISPPSTTFDPRRARLRVRVPRRERIGQEHDDPHANRRARTDRGVTVDGVVIRTPRRVRVRIGYMGQKVSLYTGLSIRENVEFYAGLYGIEGDALERRWGALCERLALADAEGERPENLPAGIRQRAGLAIATLHEPRVLFLDEPTAVDVESRGLFWDRIRKEVERGVTVFVTTH
jgi:ABC-2 type transport system ATP-binding protein